MTILVEINGDPEVDFDPVAWAEAVMIHKGVTDATVEFTFVNDPTIHAVNRDHLGHDYVTDIVTFNLAPEGAPPIGDIYIGKDEARRNAVDYATPYDREIRLLMTHGILHLMGHLDYTDAEFDAMSAEQSRILLTLCP